MVQKFLGLLNDLHGSELSKVYLHCDTSSCMMRQKLAEQRRRYKHRQEDVTELRCYDFDEGFNFSCNQFTVHQSEKKNFLSFYVYHAIHNSQNRTTHMSSNFSLCAAVR